MATPAWFDEGSGMLGQIMARWGVLTAELKQPYTEAAVQVSSVWSPSSRCRGTKEMMQPRLIDLHAVALVESRHTLPHTVAGSPSCVPFLFGVRCL